MMGLLDGYRSDPLLDEGDEIWAIARQAQLRIELGHPEDAVSHLLIDIRRFEPSLEKNPDLSFGELYALLARGYYAMGNFPYAEFHVQQAMDVIRSADPVRGEPLVLLGQIAVAKGDWDEAFEFFDEVVRDYPSTRSSVPALLGRAEVYSVLGDDDRSLADFRTLQQELIDGGPRRDVTADDVAGSLSNRHDAALTMNRLDAALQYVLLAESVYPPGRVPAELFYRIASTSRQFADNGIADARRDQPGKALSRLDPKPRYAANEHYRRAGDYFVRHARTLAGRPGADEHWADSLWLAADSYDLGGWNELAITHFVEYVAGRSEADPRRPEAVFRLAQVYHADMDYQAATRFYDQVLVQHPRSHVASRSHVPLARCLLMLDRRPEAEQHLLEVVSGKQHLRPDAVDYRDALIELGTLYHDDGRYVDAIERMDETVRRYPDDDRITDIRFRLGDSYRRHAASIDEDLGLPGVSPAERDQLEKQRTQYLESAEQLFAAIVETDDGSSASADDQQILRYAYLYRAESAYDLERYAEAVEYFDQVASRFAQHHSSMTALIQIVNCYVKLGDTNRARTAHNRALVRLNKLPDEAFDLDDALLDRKAWEQWLKNIPVDDTLTAAPGN
jgi:tetratricopeptide (TPR) repeat protein